MIEAVELSKTFDDNEAVRQISFQVEPGQTLGLIGTSGCGKTTTLKMLNRLVEPTSGRVLLEGRNVLHLQPEQLRRRIGYVIQHVGLFPHYTVADNIAVVPRLLRQDEVRIQARTRDLLDLVGLAPEQYARRYPHELSGGQQQRVGFARALAADPPVILLDEPFGGLDQITRGQMQNEFQALQRQLQKTMILVTHDVYEAVALCHRLCLMDGGVLQQIGAPRELLLRPANEFVRRFFDPRRFELELQVVRLNDLIPFLPTASTSANPTRTLASSASMFEALQPAAGSAWSQSWIAIEDAGSSRLATQQQLLQAFDRARHALSMP